MKFLKIDTIFPILLILLNICACFASLYTKDFWKCIYWISAAVLNLTVLFM